MGASIHPSRPELRRALVRQVVHIMPLFYCSPAMMMMSSLFATSEEYECKPSKCAASTKCAATTFFDKVNGKVKTSSECADKDERRTHSAVTPNVLPRRFDLSAARLVMTDDGARVTVSAPGVKPEDLTVSAIEHALHVKGETTINGDVFCVDRKIMTPRGVDLDTAKATHENGELVVMMTRKAGKRIPVNKPAAAAEDTQQPAAVDEAAAEWEPLVKED